MTTTYRLASLALTVGLVGSTLGLVGTTTAFAQGKGETIKIQDYPGIGNMLARVAIAKGYCTARGLKCEIQMLPSGPLGVQALLAKSIDVAFGPIEVQAGAVSKGAPVKAIAGGAGLVTAILIVRTDGSLAGSDKPLKDFVPSLKGKKIGVTSRGGGHEFILGSVLKLGGVQPEDATMVAVGAPNTALPALLTKQIDALVSFEPAGAICEVTKACKVLWRGSESKEPADVFGLNGAQTNHMVRQDTLDQSPHVAEAFVAALKDAEAFLQTPANFNELVQISQTFFKMEMANADEITAIAMKAGVPAYKTSIDRKAAAASMAFMVTHKLLEQPVDTARLIHDKAP
jgi:NitT/TauT family transport system substrate-binding protein